LLYLSCSDCKEAGYAELSSPISRASLEDEKYTDQSWLQGLDRRGPYYRW